SGMHAKSVCHYLATHYSLHLESGHFYAPYLIEKLAANENGGLIRAGISPYNTEEEIDRLIHALAKFTYNDHRKIGYSESRVENELSLNLANGICETPRRKALGETPKDE